MRQTKKPQNMFQTNLFCCMCSRKKRITYRFNESQAVFINCGKEVERLQSCFKVRDEHTNIFELVIFSGTFDDSFHIIDLIKCSCTILQSEKSFDLEGITNALLLSWDKPIDPSNVYKQRNPGCCFFGSSDLYFATQMASCAFGIAPKENAIFKYDMARDLTEINPLALSPSNDWIDRVYHHSEQLKFGYSIIACYSILEELKLEIISNKENPSTQKNGTVWNDSVLDDLKIRLDRNGIPSDMTIPWLVRGDYRRPFKAAVQSYVLCEWSDGDMVRDFQITIYDAILELSYIRDRMASHGVRERIYELSIYDAENAYALLRVILFRYFFRSTGMLFNWYEGF